MTTAQFQDTDPMAVADAIEYLADHPFAVLISDGTVEQARTNINVQRGAVDLRVRREHARIDENQQIVDHFVQQARARADAAADPILTTNQTAALLGIAPESVPKTMNRQGFHAERGYRLSAITAVRDGRQRVRSPR